MALLGQLSGDRNNNLNLIRMLAAIGVLVSHAWPISLGAEAVQPLKAFTGYTLGTICVFVFFGISGFLIAGSFENSRSHLHFILARTLRLVPSLVVSLLLVALVMGPAVTTLPAVEFLLDGETWSFLVRNTFLAFPQYTLPGVFVDNPYPTVEGSIWTLIHEVMCYLGLFLAGIAGVLRRRRLASVSILAFLALGFTLIGSEADIPGRLVNFVSLSIYFAVGTLFYLWRHAIPIHGGIAAGLVVLAFLLQSTPLYPPVFAVALVYGVFFLGYGPGGAIRRYNRIGDYSYGVYIYAFPAQGLAVWLYGPMTPLENILIALPLTLAPSIASWHLIEAPALKARPRFAEAVEGLLSRRLRRT